MIDPLNPDYSNTPVSPMRPRFGYDPADPSALEPVVSIVTPFYNTGEVFEETVKSILGQSLQQFEWLIVDDCTTAEHGLEILRWVSKLDPRIRVIRTEANMGPAAARNFGVRLASAPYAAFIDSDDLFEPTALEKLCWALHCQPQFSFAAGHSVGFGASNYLWRDGFHNTDAVLERNPIVGRSVVRKDVYLDAGGMPESTRNGFEDWEFWLRCASKGYWGLTVTEFLDWYRRRPDHSDRWSDWDGAANEEEFRRRMRAGFKDLYRSGVPRIRPTSVLPYSVPDFRLPFRNPLAKRQRRLLCIFPHMEMGGADKFNLDMIGQLQSHYGYEVTVVTTLSSDDRWRHHFETLTPDVFTLSSFLPATDYPRFIQYLIESREVDIILISHSQLAYLLTPFLRSLGGNRALVDYLHIEEDHWKFGNYPRYSLNYSALMDLTIVSSEHLKEWMVARGGDAEKIEVCTTNIDSDYWKKARFKPAQLRAKYEIPEGLPVISFAGRLTDQKQPKVMAEVIRLLRDRGGRFVCLVAGDGPDLSYLQEYVGRHSLSELRLLGAISNAEVQEVLAISDLYFMPSAMEGIALILYEAMAMGVVPVSAAVGGQAELVTPECGYLIEHGPNEVMAYVEVLAALLRDDRLRHRMGTAARQRIEQFFELRQMGRRLSELLDKALAGEHRIPDWKELSATTVIETIEQHRMEALAHELWAARTANGGGQQASDGALAELSKHVDYYEYLKSLGSVLAGNVFALPRLLQSPGPSLMGLARSIGLLHSGGNTSAGRRTLRRVLAQPKSRAFMAKAFRPQDYLARYPDVGRLHLEPLLHYFARGMAEDRIPASGTSAGAQIFEAALKQQAG
jgi:glycosyltransferase involved in cell wall biosynthesis